MSSCPALGAVRLLWAVFLEVSRLLAVEIESSIGCTGSTLWLTALHSFTICRNGGELGTGWCVSAAGMEGWVARLVFVPIGDCCLGCVVGDDCGVFWGCVWGCVLFELCDCCVEGCGGTTNCGGVC